MGSRSQHSYGSPLSTPKPGGTTRSRPKPGDRDPNYKPEAKKPRRPANPKPPETAKRKKPDYPSRDYRGVDGAVEDAEKGKKK
jgi:hypothetical protein